MSLPGRTRATGHEARPSRGVLHPARRFVKSANRFTFEHESRELDGKPPAFPAQVKESAPDTGLLPNGRELQWPDSTSIRSRCGSLAPPSITRTTWRTR